MARGLVLWAQLHADHAVTGPSAAVYCHNKEAYRPHEAEQLCRWARARQRAAREKKTPRELVATRHATFECPLTVARSAAVDLWFPVEGLQRWSLLKGMRCLNGNWLLHNEAQEVAVLVGTNTPDSAITAMLEDCVRALAGLHGWTILE